MIAVLYKCKRKALLIRMNAGCCIDMTKMSIDVYHEIGEIRLLRKHIEWPGTFHKYRSAFCHDPVFSE